MASTNIPDSGIEVTAGAGVDTAVFLVPSTQWVVTNTGAHDAVIGLDAQAVLTRSQPVGPGERYLPPGASASIPLCKSVTYQDASDANTTTLLFSKE